MEPARIAELLAPFLASAPGYPLKADDLKHISMYIDMLERWNARVNLTAVRDAEAMVTRHFGESLFAARHLFPGRSSAGVALADVGSGAGFPGIPIKLWASDLQLTLIESNHKKAAFLREVSRALAFTDIEVKVERVEALPIASFDVVTLRAVERFVDVLPVAARLARPKGRLALLISSAQRTVCETASGVLWQEPIPIPLSASRILLIGSRE